MRETDSDANVSVPGPTEAPQDRYARQRRVALDTITDFAYVFDREGRFTFIDQALLDLWGLTLEQAAGKNFFDLQYPPALAAKLQRQIREVIETRQRVVDETPYTSPSGAGGFYQYIFSPVLAADGTVEAVAGSTRDISDYKRLEAERETLVRTVEAERAKLAGIIASAPAFICTLAGPEHIFELANERYYDLIGRRDVIGKSLREALPELEGQDFFELLDKVYRTGETFRGNDTPVLLKRPDSGALERVYLNFVYQPLRDSAGRIAGIFVHGFDVTDMVLAREAARASESWFRQVADAMPQIVWAANAEGVVDYYNRRWFEFIDKPVDAGEEAWWEHYVHPEDLPRVGRAWEVVLKSGDPYQIEFRVRGSSNEYRWFLVRAAPVRNEHGTIVRWFGTCTDIDAIKQLTAEREHLLQREQSARADAETASRAKDTFIAVLSHELRTPLSPVVMTLPAMEADAELPPRLREDLAMIRRNIDLEVKLIDDLLDLSRITTGKLRLQMEPVSVHAVLRHAVHSSLSDTAGKHLHVVTEFGAANDRLIADPARLQQVFWNLLRNAVKFTPEAGRITVRTANSEGGKHIRIEISDTGVGIPADVLPKIFDAFEQGDARVTRQFGGLGLGLAIAKAVTELHGGSLAALSAGQDRGAAFTVTLQIAPHQVANKNPTPDAVPPEKGKSPSGRILLVEDHPDTARTMARVLQASGYQVTCALSVAGALEAAAGTRFDLVISDIGLPDATGYDLMRELRRRYQMNGIALSGYGMEEDARKSLDAGFTEHIVKPVNFTQLEAAIDRALPSR